MNILNNIKRHYVLTIKALKIFRSFPMPILLSRSLSALLQAGIPFINIWFFARIINELAGDRDVDHLTMLVLLTIGLNLVAQLAGFAVRKWVDYCNSNMWFMMFNILSEKLLSMDYADIENPEIQQKHTNIRSHQNGMGFGLPRVLSAFDPIIEGFIRVCLSVAFAFTMFTYRVPENSPLAWLDAPWAILLVILTLCCSIFLSPYISMIGGRIWAKASEMNNQGNRFFAFYCWTMISGSERAKDLRIYDQKRITDKTGWGISFLAPWIKFASYNGKFSALSTAVSSLANGLIYLYIALKALSGAFGVGYILQYVNSIMQFGTGFSAVLFNMGNLVNNSPYLEKTLEFLDIPNKKHQGTIPIEKRDDNKYELEFKNVSFKYPGSEQYTLKNLSFKLQMGQRLAVVGMNGSGKTTMIKLMCRLYDPTEGEITLNGIDIKKYNYNEYLAIFGVVFQDFELLPFSIAQNVAASVKYDPAKVEETLTLAGFGDRLEAMPEGIETHINKDFSENGVEVSGGEAQKIALARALYKNTPFIILDEPTAALDPIAEYEIYTKFNEIVGNKTAVYISHRLSSCRFCDDILVFHEGEMIQRGNHDVLVADIDGKYCELWNAQAQYYSVSS